MGEREGPWSGAAERVRASTEAAVQVRRGALERPDGTVLATYAWLPAGEVRGVVYLAHGMEERASRYEGLARVLAGRGYAVHAHDHRGHAATARGGGRDLQLTYVADHGGWEAMVNDIEARLVQVGAEHRGARLALIGHSMGSVLARDLAIRQARRDLCARRSGAPITGPAGNVTGHVDAFVFLGTVGPLGAQVPLGLAGLRAMAKVHGWGHPSSLVQKLVFGSFNQHFRPTRTDSDWVSRDEAAVDSYTADPWCGATAALSFWRDLLAGVGRVNDRAELGLEDGVNRVPEGLFVGVPMLFASGTQDPAGDFGRGARAAAALAREAGGVDVTAILVRGARHSLHEELDREHTFAYLADWVEPRLARG